MLRFVRGVFLGIFTAQLVGVTLAAAQGIVTFRTFHCHDGTDFVVAFSKGTSRAQVQLDGKAMTLPRRVSLSGVRYSAGGITLRIKENVTTLSRGRQTTE